MNAISQRYNVGGGIGRMALEHPDREAIVAPDIRLSYEKTWMIGKCFAAKMAELGIDRQTTVALHSRDLIASVGVMIATALLGAKFVVFDPDDPEGMAETTVLFSPDQQKPSIGRPVMMTPDWSPLNSEVPNDEDVRLVGYNAPDDPWWTIHTSGTTGNPKSLALTHRIAFDRSIAVQKDFNGEATRFCSLFPCNTRPFFVRAMAALLNGSTIVDAVNAEFLTSERVTLFAGSPKQVGDWIKAEKVTSQFPRLQVSGAPLRENSANQFLQCFSIVEDVYGSGETNKSFVSQFTLEDGHLTVIGKRQDSDVEILDAKGDACKPGTFGEVRIRNSYMVKRYENDPVASGRVFRSGWFYPGDLASWTENGALKIVGRVDQLINLDGTKVDPGEIEDVLQSSAGVKSACVFLDPRKTSPLRTMAFFEVHPGADIAETVQTAMEDCGRQLGYPKTPGYSYVVPKIPVTHDGVPRRLECMRMAQALLQEQKKQPGSK